MDLGSDVFDLCMWPLEAGALQRRRRDLIPQAGGRVLELGAGTGANLPFYDYSRISELHLTDPRIRAKLLARSELDGGQFEENLRAAGFGCRDRICIHEAGAERLPFPEGYFDAVVFTLVFCMVGDPLSGLREVRRVLHPAGRLYFIEHVISERPGLRGGMELLNRPWSFLTGGCNINRDTAATIHEAGFAIESLERSANGLIISGVASIAGA